MGIKVFCDRCKEQIENPEDDGKQLSEDVGLIRRPCIDLLHAWFEHRDA